MQVEVDDDAFDSLSELQAFYPGLTLAEFEIIDMNGDKLIGQTEYHTPETQAVFDKN